MSYKRAMKRVALIWLSYLGLIIPLLADSPAPPKPLFFSSTGGEALFTMLPATYEGERLVRKAFGVAYSLLPDGKQKELYRTSGWYSFEVFISNDGRYLVQLGPWNVGDRPSGKDLAIAFYKDGQKMRSYSTADLVKDPEQVLVSTSHYMWRAPALSKTYKMGEALLLQPTLNDYAENFTLHTIDGWTYVFDLKTGKMKKNLKTEEWLQSLDGD